MDTAYFILSSLLSIILTIIVLFWTLLNILNSINRTTGLAAGPLRLKKDILVSSIISGLFVLLFNFLIYIISSPTYSGIISIFTLSPVIITLFKELGISGLF
jgi:hypothetical protein